MLVDKQQSAILFYQICPSLRAFVCLSNASIASNHIVKLFPESSRATTLVSHTTWNYENLTGMGL